MCIRDSPHIGGDRDLRVPDIASVLCDDKAFFLIRFLQKLAKRIRRVFQDVYKRQVQDIVNGIHLEQVSHALHHAGQALQAHARINVGALQARICALAV